MRSLKHNFKAILAITFLFNGLALSMEKPAQKQAWLKKAQEAQIANPLKIRVVNHTTTPIKSNKGNDEWAQVPHNYGLEIPDFNMDKPTQYTIRTPNKVYVMNIERSGNSFKAVLEKLKIPASELNALTDIDLEVLNLAAIADKKTCKTEQVEPADVLTVILDEDSIEMTTNERDQLTAGKMGRGWFNVATDLVTGFVSDPLKMRIVNHTGNQVRTVQQGRGNLWWAHVDPNYIFEDAYFNLTKLDENPLYKDRLEDRYKKAPQYTISTEKNLYTVNFIKNGPFFTALLERIEGLAKSSKLSESTHGDLVNLAKHSGKTRVQSIEPVKQGDIFTVTLDEEHNAHLSVNE